MAQQHSVYFLRKALAIQTSRLSVRQLIFKPTIIAPYDQVHQSSTDSECPTLYVIGGGRLSQAYSEHIQSPSLVRSHTTAQLAYPIPALLSRLKIKQACAATISME